MKNKRERISRALGLAALVLAACDTGGGGTGGGGGSGGAGELRDAEPQGGSGGAMNGGSGGSGGRGGSGGSGASGGSGGSGASGGSGGRGGSGGSGGAVVGGSGGSGGSGGAVVGGSGGSGGSGGAVVGGSGGSGGAVVGGSGGSGGSGGAGGAGGGCLADEECPAGTLCIEGLCQAQLPIACEAAVSIDAPGTFVGSTAELPDTLGAICGEASGGEAVFTLAPGLGEVCISTLGTGFDTILSVRSVCGDAGSELLCNDDSDLLAEGLTSDITLADQAAPVTIVLDGYAGAAGDFVLTVTPGACGAPPAACMVNIDCAAGEICEAGVCVPAPAECAADADCPLGTACVEGACVEIPPVDACSAPPVIDAFGTFEANSSTGGASNAGSCGGPESGRELVWQLAPGLGPVCLTTGGSNIDTVVYVRSACGDAATEIDCADDVLPGVRTSELSLVAQDAATFVFVDAYYAQQAGPVVLSVTPGPCPEHVACESDLNCAAPDLCTYDPETDSNVCVTPPADCFGDLQCGEGLACVDGVCTLPPPPVCRIDADCAAGETCTDGACVPVPVACVADADCAAGEACLDGVCAVPPGCAADADCQPGETCVGGACLPSAPGGTCEAPTVIAAAGLYAGTTAGLENLQDTLVCNGGEGPETTYLLDPALGDVCVRSWGSTFDTVLHVRSGCGDAATELSCNDDTLGTQSELYVPAQEGPAFLFVDGYGPDSAGPYVLRVTQGNCDVQCAVDPDCPDGRVCAAGECRLPECADDGECASWAACVDRFCTPRPCADDAACGDGNICTEGTCGAGECGTDEDCGRGETCMGSRCVGHACAADADCAAGELCIEGICLVAPAGDACTEPTVVDGFGTLRGTTVGAPDLRNGDCNAGISPEVAYALPAGVGVICAEVHGNGFDTVMHARRACGDAASQLACNDDLGLGALGSRVEIDLTAEGAFLFVDGYNGAAGTYVLTLTEGPCGEPVACAEDAECADGRVCNGGVCTTPICVDTTDCPAFRDCAAGHCLEIPCEVDETCVGGICELGACAPPQCADAAECPAFNTCDAGRCNPIACELDADCAEGICEGGFCQGPLCSADADCAVGEGCDAGRCVAVTCVSDPDCPVGSICNDGIVCSAPECAVAADCGLGFDCQSSRCVELSCVNDGDCAAGALCIDAHCIDAPNGDACDDATLIDAFGALQGTTAGGSAIYGATCGAGASGAERVFLVDSTLGVVCLTTYGSTFDTILHTRSECGISATETDCNDDAFQRVSALTVDATGGPVYAFVDGYDGAEGDYVLNVSEGPCAPIDCLADADCDAGFACNEGACVEIPPPPCAADADCAANEACVGGVCAPRIACATTDECAGGETCELGFCLPSADACVLPVAIQAVGSTRGTTLGGSAAHTGSCAGDGTETVFALDPALGVVCVDTVGTNFDTVLYARTGCGDEATETTCNDDALDGALATASEITVPAADGPRYVFVDAFRVGPGADFVLNVTAGPCACRADGACGDAQHCIEGTCTDIPAGGCLLDADCADGERCVDQLCAPPANACDTAAALPDGEHVVVQGATNPDDGSSQNGSCAPANGAEQVYVFDVATPTWFSATADGFDTVLYLRGDCYDSATEVDCNDDAANAPGSTIAERLLPAGTYALVVDGYSSLNGGAFTLDVTRRADCPNGAAATCGEAALGQVVGTRYTCDRGVYTVAEACANGCAAGACVVGPRAGTCDEPLVLPYGPAVTVQDDTTRGRALQQGTCGGANSGELVYRLDVPVAATLDIRSSGFDTILYVRSTCGDTATQIACNNNSTPPGGGGSRIFRRFAAGTYYIVVDGRGGRSGAFELSLTAN